MSGTINKNFDEDARTIMRSVHGSNITEYKTLPDVSNYSINMGLNIVTLTQIITVIYAK